MPQNRAMRRAKQNAQANKGTAAKGQAEPPSVAVNLTWSSHERTVIAWFETLHKDFLELGAKLDNLTRLLSDPDAEPEPEEDTKKE